MLQITRGFLALLLLAAAVQAQDLSRSEPPVDRNHVFFHPVLAGLSLLIPTVPLVIPVTFERNLAAPGVSLVYHPMLILGNYELEGDGGEEDLRITEYGLNNTLGLRKYFKAAYRGFYLQASGRAGYSWANLEGADTGNEADVNVLRFGALFFVGYRWTHVFMDIGGGYGYASGTATTDDGDEVELAGTGPALDLNVGFGF